MVSKITILLLLFISLNFLCAKTDSKYYDYKWINIDGVETGHYTIKFDGSNLASGVYLYNLIVDGNSIGSKKMILVR